MDYIVFDELRRSRSFLYEVKKGYFVIGCNGCDPCLDESVIGAYKRIAKTMKDMDYIRTMSPEEIAVINEDICLVEKYLQSYLYSEHNNNAEKQIELFLNDCSEKEIETLHCQKEMYLCQLKTCQRRSK